MEAFPVPEYAKANPNENHGGFLLRSAIVMACLSPTAVALRFLSRKLTKVPLLADDWLILAALPFALMECAIDIYGPLHNHFGAHLQFSTPESLRRFFQTTFAFELAYNFAIVLPKFSMLALYWRLFGTGIKWPLITTAGITLAFFLACTFTAIFACNPISDYWDNPLGGHCLDHIKYYIGQAVCNITIDIVLMLLPVIPISRLQMSISQKIAVSGIFFIGAFVTLCSGLRLNRLVSTSRTTAIDPTFALVDAAVWSVIETNLSVVCVCLPSMRPLLRMILHGRLRTSNGSAARHSGNRRSYHDSTTAANHKRRSAVAPSRQGMVNGISKEQRTDVSVAEGMGSDVELGYFATVTAHNNDGEHGRDKEIEDTAVSDTSSAGGAGPENFARARNERYARHNDGRWRRRNSSLSVDVAREQHPGPWPLGPNHPEYKDMD